MNQLSQLQNKFQDYLLNLEDDFKHEIVGTEKVPAETRLAIYGNAYRSRLIDALLANYPILNIYLGAEQFEELALSYINAFPSCYRSIRWFGDQLSYFLAENLEYAEFPYLAELTQFEWTQTLVFDAKDSTILQLETIASIPADLWGEMTFKIHPSTHRLNLSWNVVPIWQALTDEKTPPDPIQNEQPIPWILWRKELLNQFCSLSEDEAWAIDAISHGHSFQEICEGLCQWNDENEAPMQAASLLKGWILAGLISEIILPCDEN